ncbi:MAG: c-type cytochrome biogenesis protein CcmI [Paracoccus sp. (in: a-proteobacteria)]
MFWLFAAILIVIVLAAILWPFRRHGADAASAPAAAYDLRVYRDQLAEVERDLGRGIIDPSEAERLRTEIGRKVLEADRGMSAQAAGPAGSGRHLALAGGILIVLIAGSFWLYARMGAPSLPDMPLAVRVDSAEARYASRPSQAEAEAAYKARLAENPPPTLPDPDPDPEFATLIEQLRAAVEKHPDDPRGLALLARNESRMGNIDAALTAQRHLIEVVGDQAMAEDHAFLAGLMAEAAGGLITPETEAEIAMALKIDSQNVQARYMTGLLQAQNGRPDRAFPVWAALLEETPPDSPWNSAIRPLIGKLAWLAGQPDYAPPQIRAPAIPGPDADQMAAAADMTPEQQQEFVRSMVAQLEERLAEQGGTPEDWARLITALGVQGETDHAREILAEAQARFADQPEALTLINEAAMQAGLAQ